MFELTHDTSQKAAVRAQCARVWCLLAEAKRVLNMRPMPKSVDPMAWKAMRSAGAKQRKQDLEASELPTSAPASEPKPKESL